jgi:hypothetical protein
MMRRIFLMLALAGAAIALPATVRGQTRADTAAVLLDAARKLQQQGDNAAARALVELIRRDYAGTGAAGSAASLLAGAPEAARAEESGKVELTVWGTTYGTWLGIATPVMLGSDSPSAYGVGLLTGAPLGFFTSRAYLKAHPDLTIGQARAMTFGGTWGTWQGAGWMLVLGDRRENTCADFGECNIEIGPSTKKLMAGMIAGGIAGIATGAIIAGKPVNTGVASTVSASGLWGSWFGVAGGTLAGLDGDNLLASTLIVGDAAVAAAGILAPKWNPSVSRVRLVSLSGLVGGIAGAGVDLIVQPDDEKVGVLIPLTTSVLGLMLGSHATRDYDRTHRSGAQREGNALIERDGSGWRVSSPVPVPSLIRHDDRRGSVEPALSFHLLSARF